MKKNQIEEKIKEIVKGVCMDKYGMFFEIHPIFTNQKISELSTLFQTELEAERLRIAREVEGLKKEVHELCDEPGFCDIQTVQARENYNQAIGEVLQIIGGKV